MIFIFIFCCVLLKNDGKMLRMRLLRFSFSHFFIILANIPYLVIFFFSNFVKRFNKFSFSILLSLFCHNFI